MAETAETGRNSWVEAKLRKFIGRFPVWFGENIANFLRQQLTKLAEGETTKEGVLESMLKYLQSDHIGTSIEAACNTVDGIMGRISKENPEEVEEMEVPKPETPSARRARVIADFIRALGDILGRVYQDVKREMEQLVQTRGEKEEFCVNNDPIPQSRFFLLKDWLYYDSNWSKFAEFLQADLADSYVLVCVREFILQFYAVVGHNVPTIELPPIPEELQKWLAKDEITDVVQGLLSGFRDGRITREEARRRTMEFLDRAFSAIEAERSKT